MMLAILIMSILALFIGLSLVYAQRKFRTAPDPLFESVAASLPGVNCGGCGFAGCSEYARAVIKNPSLIGRCGPGGDDTQKTLSTLLGHRPPTNRPFAVIKCKGGLNCEDKAEYRGIETCAAATLVCGGQKKCSDGCIGFGDCVAACPYDALHMGTKGYPLVDVSSCKACGKCVVACPKRIPSIRKKNEHRFISVDCLSHDTGKKVIHMCSHGCIACKACERVCPKDAITVKDNLAVIDYSACIGCRKCIAACPKGAITEIDT